jgi:hypothetical protein
LRAEQALRDGLARQPEFGPSISGDEIIARVGDHLLVGRVIDRFDTHDLRHECCVVFVNVFDEFELGPGRAHDQDFLGALQSLDDGVIEVIRIGRVVVLRGGFGMSMQMMLRRRELQGLRALAVDAKQFRFVLVNPNGYVVEGHVQNASNIHAHHRRARQGGRES